MEVLTVTMPMMWRKQEASACRSTGSHFFGRVVARYFRFSLPPRIVRGRSRKEEEFRRSHFILVS
eukprot:scaffold17996_cov194-Amphora_coffeaeformis.AAC.10